MEQKDKKPVAEMFISNLTIAFIVLKLCGVISWSWLWVISPVWIPILFAIIVVLIGKIVK